MHHSHNRNPYTHDGAPMAGYDLNVNAWANIPNNLHRYLYALNYGTHEPGSRDAQIAKTARTTTTIAPSEVLTHPALLAQLRPLAEARAAGRPHAELAPLWEDLGRILPPVAGDKDPLPLDVPQGPELRKRVKFLRRAIGLFSALTAAHAIQKAQAAGAVKLAGAAVAVGLDDVRDLTRVRPGRREAAAVEAIHSLEGRGRAPIEKAQLAAAEAWPPLADDESVVAQAEAAGVSPESVVSLCDFSAPELDDGHALELMRFGLLMNDPIDPQLWRRTPAGWGVVERVSLKSLDPANPKPFKASEWR